MRSLVPAGLGKLIVCTLAPMLAGCASEPRMPASPTAYAATGNLTQEERASPTAFSTTAGPTQLDSVCLEAAARRSHPLPGRSPAKVP